MKKRRAAVVGAGPAGLVTAKTLLAAGLDVTIFEKGSFVGGTWVYDNDNGRQYLYRNLHINTSRALTAFRDFPFDASVQLIPDHRDLATYLKRYADHFGLTERVRFRSEVKEVQPIAGGRGGWTVSLANAAAETFDCVVVCTSPFADPIVPRDIEQVFTGELLHSSAYRAPEAFVGKRVCIIGAGNSAVDIASDICTTAARTVIVARSGVFVMPHTVMGRSIGDLNHRYLQKPWIPSGLRRRIIGLLVHIVHGRMTDHGFKPLKHRVHATISSTIIQDIIFKRVQVKNGIQSIEGDTVRFDDGSSEQFDSVIAATGFTTEFPFLSAEIIKPVGSRLDLFKRIVSPDWPGIYFVGMINLDTPINFACEKQAQWIAELELGGVTLPTPAEMHADVAAKQRWVEGRYGTAQRHGVQEESVLYYAELDRELKQGRRRLQAQQRQLEATGEVKKTAIRSALPGGGQDGNVASERISQ